jgi:hypothetical protein
LLSGARMKLLRIALSALPATAMLPAFWVLVRWRDHAPRVFGVPMRLMLPLALATILVPVVVVLRWVRCPSCGLRLESRRYERCPGCDVLLLKN